MARWVALLRAVNLGGRRVVMADLRQLALTLGWRDVSTHIASGNLLFDADGTPEYLADRLRRALADAMWLEVPCLVLSADALHAVLDDCPVVPEQGSNLHGYLCWREPVIDDSALARLKADDESLVVRGKCVWLHAPSGVGRSDLANRIGKVVTGTEMTARNLNTLRALAGRLG